MDLEKHIDLTIGGLKKVINEKFYIPEHRQKLLFDDKEIIDNNIKIRNIEFRYFYLVPNNTPKENDFVNVKLIYKSFTFMKDINFELKVDLYGNLIKQIAELKNIEKKSLYIIYRDDFFDYDYKIYSDHRFGKKIVLHLYKVDDDGWVPLFVKTLTGKTIIIKTDLHKH